MTLQDEINSLLTCRGIALGTLSAEEVGTWTNGVYTAGIKPSFVPSAQLDAIIAAYQAQQNAAPTPTSHPVPSPVPAAPVPPPTSNPTPTPLGSAPAPTPTPVPAPVPTTPPPSPVSAPASVVSQALVVNAATVRVGDEFTVTGTLKYSDGSTKPVTAYRLYGYDESIVFASEGWNPVFVAKAVGTTIIDNDNSNVTGKVSVTVVPSDGSPPVKITTPTPSAPTPSIPTAPSGAPSPVVLNPPVSSTRKAFTGAELHWRDTESTLVVNIGIKLTDGTQLAFKNGPVGVAPLTNPDGSPHSHLTVARYVDGVVIENPWVDSTENLAGHLTVEVDGTVVFDQDNVRFDLRCGTAIIRTGFKQFTPIDIRNQIGKLLPNYGDPGTFRTFTPVDLGINGRGYCTYEAMGSTGGRQEIGLIPGSDLAYAIRGEQWQAARDGADHFRGSAACVRDPNTGMPLDPSQWPSVSLLEAHLGYNYGSHGVNPVTVMSASPLTPDPAHQPHFGVVPFLATGSDFDMETLLFWASYQSIWNNAAYRQYGNFIVSDSQTRGMAWGIATFGYAAKLLEGRHPQAQVYRDALTRTATYYWAQRLAPGMPQNNMFGVFPELPYEDAQGHCRATATWQNAFLASALHLMVQYGFDEFKDWRDSSAALPVNIAQNMCYQLMSIYCLAVVDPVKYKSDSQALAGGEYYTSWNGVMNDSMANKYNDENDYGGNGTSPQIGTLCGKLTFNSTVGGLFGSSGSFISFAANIQPAIAAAVDAGIPGATDAWTKFQQWSGHIDYTYGAEFNIVPVAV